MAKRGRKPYTAQQKARAYELKKAKQRVKYMEKQGYTFTEEFKKSLETRKTKTLQKLKGKALKGKATTWTGEASSVPISIGTRFKSGKKHEKEVTERLKEVKKAQTVEKAHRQAMAVSGGLSTVDDLSFRKSNIEKTLNEQMNSDKGSQYVYEVYQEVGGTGSYDDFLEFMVKAVDEGYINLKDINYKSAYRSNETASSIAYALQKMGEENESYNSQMYDDRDDLEEYIDKLMTDENPPDNLISRYNDWVYGRIDKDTLLSILMNYYR